MDGLTDRRVRGGMNHADFHVCQFLVLVISRPKLPIVKAMNQSEHPSTLGRGPNQNIGMIITAVCFFTVFIHIDDMQIV